MAYSYPRVPPLWRQTTHNTFVSDVEAFMNGFTAAGVFRSPYSYLVTTDGVDVYACNAYQIIYGGPSDAGGVDGGDPAAVLQAVFDDDPDSVFINGDINVDDTLVLHSNLELWGDGKLTLTTLPAVAGGATWGGYTMMINENFQSGGDEHIHIHDLRFEVAASLIGIGGYTRTVFVGYFMGASHVTVENCTCTNSSFYFEPSDDYLDSMAGALDVEFLNTDANDIVFRNNKVFNGVEGGWLHLVNGACFEGNWIETTLDSGFGFHWGGRGYHIINNTILRLTGDSWTPNDIAGASIEVTSAKNGYASAFWQEKHVISGNIIRSKNTGYRAEIAFNGFNFRDILISNNYIDNIYDATLSTGTYNSGIHVQGQRITVCDNVINLSQPNSGLQGVYLWINTDLNAEDITIEGNVINGAKNQGIYVHTERNGITISNVAIVGNVINNTTAGSKSILTYANFGVGNLANILISNNIVDETITAQVGTVRNNIGYVTENSGTGSIDNGSTSDVIAHGCSYTPARADITITLGENPTNDIGAVWVDTIGAANFTVRCENDPGASNLDFSWAVRKV